MSDNSFIDPEATRLSRHGLFGLAPASGSGYDGVSNLGVRAG